MQSAGGGRVLQQHPEAFPAREFLVRVADQNLEAHKACPGFDNRKGLRVNPIINEEYI